MQQTFFSIVLALSLTSAQTFPGFPIEVTTPLQVVYSDNVSVDGQQLQWQQTLSSPNIQSPAQNTTGRSCLIMMDSDVPLNSTTRTTLLHWLAPDITSSTNGSQFLQLPSDSDANLVPYLNPSPPDQDYPHRYSFILFEQPSSFAVPSAILAARDSLDARFNFNLTDFMAETGLTNALAANYMLVANNSGPATTCYPAPLYTTSIVTSSFTDLCTASSAPATTTTAVASSSGAASASASATPAVVSVAAARRNRGFAAGFLY